MSPGFLVIRKRMKGNRYLFIFYLYYTQLIFANLLFINIFRLFFGDQYQPLNITSIRIIETCSNLEKQISAITALDAIISNNHNKVSKDSEYGPVLEELFSYSLSSKQQRYNKYLYQTFQCFVNHKQKIEISIPYIDLCVKDKALRKVLFYDIVCKKEDKDNPDISGWIDLNNKENLVKPDLFNIFKNIKEITIIASYGYYPCSLLLLSSIIQSTPATKVTIYVRYEETWKAVASSSVFRSIVNA